MTIMVAIYPVLCNGWAKRKPFVNEKEHKTKQNQDELSKRGKAQSSAYRFDMKLL